MRRVLVVVLLVAAGTTVAGTSAAAASGKPVVSKLSPSSGPTAGGAVVTIKGERFHHVRKVLFGSAAGTSVRVKSATKLTVRAPQHSAGTVSVRVETTAGKSNTTSKDHYTYKLVWTPKEAPLPKHGTNPDVALLGLVCPTAGTCVSVGNYFDSSGGQQGLVERLAGGKWSATKAAVPSNALKEPGAALTSVACPTAGICVAVGRYVDSSDHQQGLIDTFAHGKWTAKEASLPTGVTGSNAQLGAVACAGTGHCAAVGNYIDSNSQSQGLLEMLVSGKWSAGTAPLPADASLAPSVQLAAVACPAAGSCVAVGDYANPEQVGLVETLSNGHWHAAEADLPGSADKEFQDVFLTAVSCKSPNACTAVGQYRDKKQNPEGLIETLPVGISSGSEAAAPSDDNPVPNVGLSAVSCASFGCTAVGSYRDASPTTAGLIELLPGPGAPTRAPVPAAKSSTSFADLTSVSCPGSHDCTTVGFYTASGVTLGLADNRSGSTWHAIHVPMPANASTSSPFAELGLVSCPTTTECVAVGQYQGRNGDVEGLLEIN